MDRTRESFDFGWKFHLGDIEGARAPGFDDSGWRELDIPHDWSIEGPFDEHSPSGQSLSYLPGGVGLYRKTFFIDKSDGGRKLFIDFDGVYRFTDVWLNGHHLGFFPDGYTGFGYDITSYVNFGTGNMVCVRVDNSQQPNSRWYSGSGIYRHVWLTKTSNAYIVKDSAYVTTPGIGAETSVRILSRVKNDTKAPGAYSIVAEILDAGGKTLTSRWDGRIIDPGGAARFENILWMDSPTLWDTENPYLYTARLKLYEGEEAGEGRLMDSVTVPFGARAAEFNNRDGFLLNGKRVKIKGVCLHHDAGRLGAAVPERVWERRLKKLKDMGCNGIRTAHAPMAPEFMDMCDRMGFLVMDEVFDEWRLCWEKNYSKTRAGIGRALDARYGSSQYFDEHGYENLASVIRRDRNHPCVVMWGIGNEIFEQSESFGHIIAQRLVEVCHIEDPARPAMSACERIRSDIPGGAATTEFLEAIDLVGYNYTNRWRTTFRRFYAEDRERSPHWRVLGAENSNVYSQRGRYALEPCPENRGRPYFTAMLEVEEQWKFTRLYDYVAGDYIWAGIDYLGESAWPRTGNPAGMLDTAGFEKDSYYFFASQWSGRPVLKLIPHWNWEGREGQAIPVVCYTNCDEVELFVNGKSYGTQAYDYFREGQTKEYEHYDRPMRMVTTQDLHLLWMIPYEAGELRAVGKKDGKTYEDTVATCSAAVSIALEPDCGEIKANGLDICHVTVRLLDKNGNFAALSDDRLDFELEGGGELLCLDSGDNMSHEIGMRAKSVRARAGLALAYVRAGGSQGGLTLTVKGDGLDPASVRIFMA